MPIRDYNFVTGPEASTQPTAGTPTDASDLTTKTYVDTLIDAINTLASGKIYLGDGSNVAQEVTPSGDVTISNTGVTAISSGVIVDGDVNASAAIARTKLASGTASHVIINDGSGVFSSEARLDKTRGGTGISSTATFPSSGTIVTETATETLTNKALSDSTTTIVDVSDATKKIKFDAAGTTGTSTTIAGSQTADRTLTLPDITDTIVTKTSADTLTNKTLTSPTLTTPVLGTPSSGTLTNCTGLPIVGGTTGTLSETRGGTNQTTFTTGDVLYASASNTLSKLPIGSSNQILKVSGGIPAWAAAPSGGINYISANPDSESDASSWTTYDDAAATPVDLTGGSFGGTFARTTTNPLRGTGSFLYTPGTTGEGVAFTITPDLSDYGNVLEFGFDYSFVTATGATGDYTVWIYDVTNSQLIQPSGYQIPGATTSVYNKFKCTFQTSLTGVTYRIGIHQAASTSAAIKFDNVYCGPKSNGYGPLVSDADTRVVAMKATTSSTSLTNSTAVDIVYSVKDFDTHGGYNTSTGVYTVPTPGVYRVTAKYYSGTSMTSPSIGRQWSIGIKKNSVGVA